VITHVKGYYWMVCMGYNSIYFRLDYKLFCKIFDFDLNFWFKMKHDFRDP